MSDLRKAAEAVLERWDSPAWEWMKQGPTAELMATLRAALAAPCLEVTVDPRLTLDEAAAISSALAAPSEDIEALRRENERLRDALQWIASRCPTDQFVDLQPHRIHLEAAHDAGACARAALQEVPR